MTETAAPTERAPASNRLSIAHLLLWTATIAMVLGFVRHAAPHFTPTSATTAQYALNLWLQYSLLFAVSPAFGAVLAGSVLAAWRVATRRFGFPAQPGHWLLLILSVVPLVVAAIWLRLSEDRGMVVVVFVTLIVLTALSSTAVVQTRQPVRWRLTFALAAWGLGGIVLSLALQFVFTKPAATMPAVLGGLSVVSSILAGLASGILDLTAPERFDVFHWIGVATLAALTAYPLLAWLIAAATFG